MPWKAITASVNKHAPKVVLILLLALLAQSLAELTWSLFDNKQKQVIAPSAKFSAAALNAKAPALNLNQVAQYHLFGDAKKTVVAQHKVIDAPDTRLQLILQGVFASNNSEIALAIIATKDGKSESYHIGDKLSGGASLHEIYADRVILKRNGTLETLRLPLPATKDLFSKSTSANNLDTPPVKRLTAVSRQKLTTLRKTLLTEPAEIWKQVRINPVMKDGRVQGYSLQHNDKALMKALGIKETDVILEVNGESLSDPVILYGLMKTLSQQSDLALTIERGGKKQSIQLSF
jgi:general secretion pathway protein C